MSDKSPISILQEYYVKQGIIPQYTSVDESYRNAGPFTFKVEAAGLSAIGSGTTKKQAKHNAAIAMLKQLKLSSGKSQEVSSETTEKQDVPKSQVPIFERPVRVNFVGKLHEYLIKSKSPTPKYELLSEDGPPHKRQFTMRCIVKDVQEEGTARSKQEAKNIAAERVWEKLESDKESDEYTKSKRRKLEEDDEQFNKVLNEFRSTMDDLGGSFYFEEETPKEYAIDAGGNDDELKKYDEKDRKMFSFLGTRNFTSLLPEKASVIINVDTGTYTRIIGARGWTRRNAMFKALSDAQNYLAKLTEKDNEKNGDEQPNVET